MTICFLANAASIHTQRWALHFSRLGYRVHVLSFSPHVIPGVPVHDLAAFIPLKVIAYPVQVFHVRSLLARIGCDIVHAHYVTSYGFVGALAGRHPLVVTAWGSDVLLRPASSFLFRKLVRFALRRADLVTSMAHHMTRVLEALGVPPEKIVTLPFGVDTATFHPGARPVGQPDVDVICTRAFEAVYNVALLLQALAVVIRLRPNLRCVIVGDGPLRDQLRRTAEELGLEGNVSWLGRLQHSALAPLLARAKVFVSPSLSDGNNISLNEAMACGCFPIATDIPANREWLADGETGFLVPPGHPEILAERILTALAADDLRRHAAAKNWQTIADRGDWHRNMASMETHYRTLFVRPQG